MINQFIKRVFFFILKICNHFIPKNEKGIFFFPHHNCMFDGYDILNNQSSNVLCLFDSILKDSRFNDYDLYVLYYHKDHEQSYIDFCKEFSQKKVHFVYSQDKKTIWLSIFKCQTIFTDADYTRIFYRTKKQTIVCLNYFGGLIKSEFHRWTNHGGFKKMLAEQKEMYQLYDFHLSISDICSKFIALDNCHYYPHFISLGFPRNDIFFQDSSNLRQRVESLVNFKVQKIITYVPTHRDYENPDREFFDPKKSTTRSIWGHVSEQDLIKLENKLAETNTLIIAKVHPIQEAETSVISKKTSNHIIFYSELTKHIKTSLNPLLAISDSIITDYTTTVYDFLYTNRPIIYYFYDIEQYRATRGFFIEPIESICAGHLTYNIDDLCNAITDLSLGKDPFADKRKFLQELFIKHLDGNSTERIKTFFFK